MLQIEPYQNGKGLSLPDAENMLELCKILEINVNELLNGEKIDMKDYKQKTEELLIELAKQEEIKNKKIMTNMWVLMITTLLFYISIILLTTYSIKNELLLGIIICTSTALTVIIAFYGLKLEVDVGYYECKNCHHRFIPPYIAAFIAPHINTTRYLKCPKCSKRKWSKKIMTKE